MILKTANNAFNPEIEVKCSPETGENICYWCLAKTLVFAFG